MHTNATFMVQEVYDTVWAGIEDSALQDTVAEQHNAPLHLAIN